MGHTACTEPQCLYKGALYRPYGLYRDSVPVQGCTLPAVRPVQSLSACTRVHFTGRTACTESQCLYKSALYRPYGLYRVSVPVQGCTLPVVRHVQSLSACTRVHFTGRMACTESLPVQGCTLLFFPNMQYIHGPCQSRSDTSDHTLTYLSVVIRTDQSL